MKGKEVELIGDDAPKVFNRLAGYEHEHDWLLTHGWRVETGKSGGGAGYNTDSKAGRRERLWMSPACLNSTPALFELGGDAA